MECTIEGAFGLMRRLCGEPLFSETEFPTAKFERRGHCDFAASSSLLWRWILSGCFLKRQPTLAGGERPTAFSLERPSQFGVRLRSALYRAEIRCEGRPSPSADTRDRPV